MSRTSVLTIVHGRDEHLRNLMLGLARQRVPPRELVIVHMQGGPAGESPPLPFPVRRLEAPGGRLPLAAARNLAARTAEGDRLIFLDVDCIPSPDLVADYDRAMDHGEAVYMGEVRYLPRGAAGPGWDYPGLDALGVRHDGRAPTLRAFVQDCEHYQGFWSLSFALERAVFERHGGFDERFTGYGGEDTDFARRCVELGIALRWCDGALGYHQHHPHHMPPVHHLDSVLRNAEIYRGKWNEPTMEAWLETFAAMGLIEAVGDGYRILRRPDEADLALTAQQSGEPYASAEAVMAILEERRARSSRLPATSA